MRLPRRRSSSYPCLGPCFARRSFRRCIARTANAAYGQLILAAEALRKGHDFLVFAEGTRSKDGRLQAFKKGPFVMAIKAQVPVAPVVLRGTRGIQPKGSMTITPGIAEIEFLSPIPTRGLGFSNRNDLRDRAHDAVSQALAAAPVGAIGAGLQ